MTLPLYYGNGLLYGMHGQIQPSAYPAGWYAADRVLAEDPNPGRAAFFPWHRYLSFSFVRNENRVIASPAPMFFSIPTVVSQDLEIPGISPPLNDLDQAALSRLVTAGSQVDWTSTLSERRIKYVLVARELDWRGYQDLDQQAGLVLVGDFGSILLYRNPNWH
jgi:hypothetical protein